MRTCSPVHSEILSKITQGRGCRCSNNASLMLKSNRRKRVLNERTIKKPPFRTHQLIIYSYCCAPLGLLPIHVLLCHVTTSACTIIAHAHLYKHHSTTPPHLPTVTFLYGNLPSWTFLLWEIFGAELCRPRLIILHYPTSPMFSTSQAPDSLSS